jgi:alkaline phosphatase D
MVANLDVNGWPQSERNRALASIRRGFGIMLAGDQHLATVVHHGIDEQGDAGVSFAVPSVANYFPRVWAPKEEGKNRPAGASPYLGEHRDGLLNRVNVLAVYNPPTFTGVSTGVHPLALHDRAPGYGIVHFDKATRKITIECWPRYADPSDPDARQYDTWPVIVDQLDNYGRRPAAYLPVIEVQGAENPVVQVINETSGDVVYTLRIRGNSFRPAVFDPDAAYTVIVGDPDVGWEETLPGLKPDVDGRLLVTPGEPGAQRR